VDGDGCALDLQSSDDCGDLFSPFELIPCPSDEPDLPGTGQPRLLISRDSSSSTSRIAAGRRHQAIGDARDDQRLVVGLITSAELLHHPGAIRIDAIKPMPAVGWTYDGTTFTAPPK
jgi:hypothetical protein